MTQDELQIGPLRLRRQDIGVVIALLCLLGFTLRAWNLNWDSGTHQHPDERHWSIVSGDISAPDSISEYFDSARSPANPYNRHPSWIYGTFPLFLGKSLAAWMTSGPGGPTTAALLDTLGVDLYNNDGNAMFNAGYDVNLVGRLLSALVDTATIAAIYFLGRELVDRRVGLLAALLQTFVVLHLQYSHFFGAEPWIPLLAVLTTIGSVRIARRQGGVGTWVWTGAALGLALAAKLSALGITAAPIAAAVVATASGLPARRLRRTEVIRLCIHAGSIVSVVVLSAAAVFRVAQPYDFVGGFSLRLDQRFLNDLNYISDVNSGGGYPWVIQWIDRQALPFALKQAFLWGLGPFLALAVVGGIAWAIARAVQREEVEWFVPLSVIGAMLALVSNQFNPVIRYLLPAYPLGVVLAAAAGVAFHTALSARPADSTGSDGATSGSAHPLRWISTAVLAMVVGANALYGFAFINGVYANGYTRTVASQWMVSNLPAGSALSLQEWDDPLPIPVPGTDEKNFRHVTFKPFVPDSPDKIEELIAALDETDYVVEASNKLYGAIPRFPAEYPATVRYYQALFDGSLGFEEVVTFERPPSLFGVRIDDQSAEETFTVYDHPPVTIWRKAAGFSPQRARAVLNPDNAVNTIEAPPRDAGSNALLLRPDDARAQQKGGTWSEVFRPDWFTNSTPWLWWLLWFELMGLIGAPIALRLFRPLIGRGVGLAKVVGLIMVAVPVWFGVSLGWFGYSRGVIVVATVAAAGCSVALMVRSGWNRFAGRGDSASRSEGARIVTCWIWSEALFLAIFGVVLALRYANPDLWHIWRGGEKPMEMAYFTATTRSSTFPPYDPWYAGGYLNYYYWGWYLFSLPTRMLGIVPDVAFNLAVPTVASLASLSVWTTSASLAEMMQRRAHRVGRHLRGSPLVAGMFGVLLFVVIGNLAAANQTWNAMLNAGRSDGSLSIPIIGYAVDLAQGAWAWIVGDLVPLDWWATSRVNEGTLDITEFPSWTVLFADLHAHYMGMIIFTFALAVLLALAGAERRGDRFRPVALAATSGLVLALVRMTHTWDFPVIAGLCVVTIMAGSVVSDRDSRWRRTLVQLVVLGVAYSVMIGPYSRSSEVFENSLQWFPGFTTPAGPFILQWGILSFLLVGYVVARITSIGWRQWTRSFGPVFVAAGLSAAFFLFGRVGAVGAISAFAAFVALSLVCVEVLRRDPNIAGIATAGFLTAATAIVSGVESVRVGNDIDRLNTVFKFSLQAWQLAAVSLGFGTWWVAQILREQVSQRRAFDRSTRVPRLELRLWRWSVVVLIVAGLVFPLRAVRPRLSDRFSTSVHEGLAGYAWLDAGTSITTMTTREGYTMNLGDDVAMIDWLRTEVDGSPIIVEGVGESYQWFGRVTSMTGLPAVVGWDWHQRQQRGSFGAQVQPRRENVDAFYQTSDEGFALRFLNTYLPKYVIVGSTEKPLLGPQTLALFDSMEELTLVFDDGKARVYEVSRNLADAHAIGSSSSGSSAP